jgi:hypothetical protein
VFDDDGNVWLAQGHNQIGVAVSKFNSSGVWQFTSTQNGKSDGRVAVHGMAIEPGTGAVYVVGTTTQKFYANGKWTQCAGPCGSNDDYVMKFSSSGDVEWVEQFGSSSTEMLDDIVFDSNKDAFLVGRSRCGVFAFDPYNDKDKFDGADGVACTIVNDPTLAVYG